MANPYALGSSKDEFTRLTLQGKLLKSVTKRFLLDSGIKEGMHVLDLGSGAGDVSVLAANIVGTKGKVVGVEQYEDTVMLARKRVDDLGLNNISFIQSSLTDFNTKEKFDAVVGRYILMYQDNPADCLTQCKGYLDKGGIVAFMEPVISPMLGPDGAIKRASDCFITTLAMSGAHIDIGVRIHKIFMSAGLPCPAMHLETIISGDMQSEIYDLIAASVKSIMPKAVEFGIIKENEFELAKLPDQLRTEMDAIGYAIMMAPTVLAWCNV